MKKGLYALKLQESVNDFFFRSCELCIINVTVNENMKPLQVLGNQICRTTILTPTYMRNSLELLATACVEHVYIKIKQFHAFVEFSIISVHRKYSSEKKRKKK